MSFGWPVALWGLLLIPLVAVLYALAQRRRTRYAVRFTNLDLLANLVPKTPGWRRHLPPALFLLAAGLLVLGLARPQATVLVPRQEATVVLAMDTSGSMVATDIEPDRLSAAQEAADTFLERMPEDLQVGLVTFSAEANILSPPTREHAVVRESVASLTPGGGTAMGDGLARAAEIARPPGREATEDRGVGRDESAPERSPRESEGSAPAAVVLLSDGENTSGEAEPSEAADAAREVGVPVFTVALGTEEGRVEVPDGSWGTRTVLVPPDRDTLRRIAETTGGEFFASTSEADLVRVYEGLGSSLGFVEEEQEVTVAFVAGALALLLAGGTLSTLWFNRLP